MGGKVTFLGLGIERLGPEHLRAGVEADIHLKAIRQRSRAGAAENQGCTREGTKREGRGHESSLQSWDLVASLRESRRGMSGVCRAMARKGKNRAP